MRGPPPPPRGGIAGMLLLFCAAIGGAGLAFDLTLPREGGAWFAAQPGARALIGAGAALAVVIAGHVLRFLLGRREKG